MDEEKQEKMVVIATHGGEHPQRASLPFMMANAALIMDAEVTVVLQDTAVTLAKKGCYEHIFAANMPPLKELVDTFIELGGLLLVCMPCIDERQIELEMLVDTAKPVKAGRVVIEILAANVVLSY
jgi:uncharacterized protein involved in oxidation of intracellular sulfur